MGAGLFASSFALIGFGADSLIESLSGGILLWRLQNAEIDESRERLALKLMGISFLCSRYMSRSKRLGRSCTVNNQRQALSASVFRSSRLLSCRCLPALNVASPHILTAVRCTLIHDRQTSAPIYRRSCSAAYC